MNVNLIYYICPFRSNNVWVENLDVLKKHLHKFTGVKIVSIAKGKRMVGVDIIKEYINDDSIHYMECINHRHLCETSPFIDMLTLLKSKSPSGITFYAHTKGVSPKYNGRPNMSKNIRIWRNVLYHFNLENIDNVKSYLNEYVSCGAIKLHTRRPKVYKILGVPWYYAGTFFWFNNEKVFAHPEWNVLRQNRFGVESYMGGLYDEKTGYCLFGEDMLLRIYKYTDQMWDYYLKDYNLTVSDFDL